MLYQLLNKFFMNDFTDIILNHLQTDKNNEVTIFDIGCFEGSFSKKLNDKIKNKKKIFFLFDPNPNLQIDDFKYYKMALSNNVRTQDFYLNNFFPSSGSSLKTIIKKDKLWNFSRKLFTLNLNKTFTSFKIETNTLNNFCTKNKINKIDILKIDAEGSELDILKGGKDILNYTQIIQIEILGTKNNFKEVYAEIVSFLQTNYNYKILIEKNIWSVGILSNLKAMDVLFVKN